MNRRAVLAVLAIAAVAAASSWLSRESREPEPTAVAPAAPDYFTRDFIAVTTGTDGRRRQELRAERMVHLPDADIIELTAPHLVVYDDNMRGWYASAQEGKVKDAGAIVRLTGNVRVRQDEPRPMELRTEVLHIYPKRNYAETEKPVTITAPEGRLEAVGLQADMERRELILLSKVRGVYEAPAR